jgi:LysR family transcriptional regulator, hca operon transcriptional activator
MGLRDRRCFVAVAEAGSLTVAAERKLHTSQPSLSRQIWVLEDEVGGQPLTRGARGIELSSARRYVKLGFGGAHTDSNQRLMYTSA